MPVAIQTGRATAAVPPTATASTGTFHFSDVTKDARGAAVIVTVTGAEAVAILVNAWIGTTDGITFGQSWKTFKGDCSLEFSGHCEHKYQYKMMAH